MVPLIALLAVFGILFAVNRFFLKGRLTLSFIGRVAMAAMLVITGTAHFTSTSLMVETMPEFIPFKKETVYLTGVLELLAAIGLLVPRVSKVAAVCLMIFFIAVLPANIVGSLKQVSLGGMENGA